MPEPDERFENQPDATANSSARGPDDDQDNSTPRADETSQATGSYLGQKRADGFDVDFFDHTILTKPSNPRSLGKLGKYEVIELVGQGGMGLVLKGYDESLGRHVAIKVLSRQLAGSATARRRFSREARAVAAISHPNVITIHAVEEQDGLPFLVMEFAEGGSLQDRIKRQAPLPLADVLRVGSQIASGLAAAHAQGIIHRDIKPGNVMLEDQVDRVKITDFGLARVALDNSDLTSQGHRLGTPAYMSPEQVHGHDIDDRTDLFSLGCVLYAMIAGKSPFRGSHSFDTARKILEESPTPLGDINDDIPPFLTDVVSRLLEKDPKKRYQTAAEVAEILNRYLSKLNQTRTDQLHTFKQQMLPDDSSAWPTRRVFGAVLLAAMTVVAVATSPFWFPSQHGTEKLVGEAPEGTTVLTVSQVGDAQFQTIGAALAKATPNAKISVLDDAEYNEILTIDDANRWSGLQVISENQAVLVGTEGASSVVAIQDTPDVVIQGFHIHPRVQQFGVLITGNSQGTTVDGVHFRPQGKHWATLYITKQAGGTRERPIEICNSHFNVNNIGVDVEGIAQAEDCIAHIRIKDNRFSGPGNHVLLVQSVRNVKIAGNTFVGGNGIVCALASPEASDHIEISNNTFLNNWQWLALDHASPALKQVSIRNNLILASNMIGIEDIPLSEFAAGWDFSNNLWEPGAETDHLQVPLVAEAVAKVDLISRDPANPEFLHPRRDSSLRDRGAGVGLPDYVGAFEP